MQNNSWQMEEYRLGGIWYDSLEDYAIGKESANQQMGDLNESNTKFICEPEGWTSGEVKVKIQVAALTEGYTLQYSTDRSNWSNYTEETEIKMSENGEIFARLVDSEGNEGEIVTGSVAKIDKQDPEVTTALNSGSQSTTGINLEIGVTDSISGISKIEWYYKKSTDPESKYEENKITDTYTEMNGKTAGVTETVTKSKELSKLEKDTTYNIYAVIYDVAGNSVRSPENGTIDIKTMASLLGRTATINGQKYILMYEPGEKIEIDGEEYEIKDAQLISANVLEPNNVYLGYNDGQVDWENADVKSEANLDGNTTLDNIEKSIYSYNHAIETLNKKCESLVDMSNPDIVSVRSVGSLPFNPNLDIAGTFSEDDLAWLPAAARSGIVKGEFPYYYLDYDRLGIIKAQAARSGGSYWVASRHYTNSYHFGDGFGVIRDNEGGLTCEPFVYHSSTATTQSWAWGVRPVICMKSGALADYLD